MPARLPRSPSLAALGLLLLLLLPQQAHADGVMELIGVMQASQDYKQRVAAALGLARLRATKAVPALIAQLEDKHHTVRGVVAAALGKIGDRRALEPLRALIKADPHRFVRGQAKRALRAVERAKPRRDVEPPPTTKRQMRVEGTLGSLDAGAIQQVVNANLGRVTRCFNASFQRAPFLGGEVLLRFRVKRDGRVRWLRIERSQLGSRASERCIVRIMRRARFDRPSGGEAEFTVPLRFGGGDTPRVLSKRSAAARALARKCRRLLGGAPAAPPGLQVTAYIKRGRVVSAGLSSAAAPVPDAFARRFISNLTRVRLGNTGNRVAKLSYRFTCR